MKKLIAMMRKIAISVFSVLMLLTLFSCKKEGTNTDDSSIRDVKLQVSFQGNKSANGLKAAIVMTKETPTSYLIGLKGVRLIGSNGTANAELFNKPNLSSSLVFDFTNNNTVHSLLNGTTIPKGNYSAIEFDIYYLQMNIAIATTTRGIERRNVRIYLSDDAETEGGLHQPGDVTQIINSQEVGWLMGKGTIPNMDPITPRNASYSSDVNGVNWVDFGGKSAKDFGPFGNADFYKNAPHPIYKTKTAFALVEGKGTQLIVDFNVNGCWQFDDKSGDGVFGSPDFIITSDYGMAWHMAMPVVTVSQN
jgi:hypothetical protein